MNDIQSLKNLFRSFELEFIEQKDESNRVITCIQGMHNVCGHYETEVRFVFNEHGRFIETCIYDQDHSRALETIKDKQ